jgi:Iap family predicted aminopeptidase
LPVDFFFQIIYYGFIEVRSKIKKEKHMNTERTAEVLGVSEKEVRQAVKQIAYRKAYNKRPDVVAKRKEYMELRNLERSEAVAELKRIHKLADENPELAVLLGWGERVAL